MTASGNTQTCETYAKLAELQMSQTRLNLSDELQGKRYTAFLFEGYPIQFDEYSSAAAFGWFNPRPSVA